MYDVIVIGGGIVGASVAYHLVRSDTKTLLIDRRDQGRATDAGAGILSAETYVGDSQLCFQFGVDAFSYYATLLEELKASGETETGFSRCGNLIVAISEDEIDRYNEAKRCIFRNQKRRGQPSSDDLHELAPNEARAMFPPLADPQGALYYRHAARVDGRLMEGALRHAAERKGLHTRQAGVDQLVLKGSALEGVLCQGERIAADQIVIAGGAWSKSFADQLGVRIAVHPQRGQIIHLGLSGAETSDWPIVTAFRDHYLLAWPDSRVVVGATREVGSGFHPQITAAGIHEVLGEALRVAPGLAPAEIREVRVGLRPLSEDGLPVLGTVPGVNGVYVATGHGPSGLSLGPYSGKILADLILGREISTDLSAFRVSRFIEAD